MAHFAKVLDGFVTKIIVAEPDFFETFTDTSPGDWIETCPNTMGGIHNTGGTPLRKNFAGLGFTYDRILDAFIPPKPFASWTLNEETCLWQAPVLSPNDGKIYKWNETALSWDEM